MDERMVGCTIIELCTLKLEKDTLYLLKITTNFVDRIQRN